LPAGVFIHVEDIGAGIPYELQQRFFDPFFRRRNRLPARPFDRGTHLLSGIVARQEFQTRLKTGTIFSMLPQARND
jgi:signal transduction histidine kinase